MPDAPPTWTVTQLAPCTRPRTRRAGPRGAARDRRRRRPPRRPGRSGDADRSGPAEVRQDLRAGGRAWGRDRAARGTARRARPARPAHTLAGGRDRACSSAEHVDRRADERRPSDERLVEHDADAVPVGRRVERLAHRLLGRHVRDVPTTSCASLSSTACAKSVATPKSSMTTRPSGVTRTFDGLMSRCSFRLVQSLEPLGEAQQCAPQPRHVRGRRRRLARRLRRVADAGDTRAQGRRARRGSSSLCPHLRPEHIRVEIGTVHELHGEEHVLGVGHHELVKTDEVRVAQVCQRPKFVLEAVKGVRVVFRQRLESHALTALVVDGLVHNAHAALTDDFHDVVARRSQRRQEGTPLPGGQRNDMLVGHDDVGAPRGRSLSFHQSRRDTVPRGRI